ncbi:MAG TPA: hypothetical protein VF937_05845, partial [Chloroflexota bacterium]
WYDVEDRFDFVYLSASRDGGRSWQVLPGLHTTSDQSTGNGYGPGWTAASGPDWIDEQVDLSPFGGSEILLRFEYVTDQSYNAQGFAFKDLRIPELGMDEPGALDAPWTAEGWVRVDGPIPERWNLRLVRWTPGGISVEPVGVDPSGTASVSLDGGASRNTLMIAAAAARTLVAADYSVSVSPSADIADGDLR